MLAEDVCIAGAGRIISIVGFFGGRFNDLFNVFVVSIDHSAAVNMTSKQDKTRQLCYIFAHNTVLTDLAPQVAEANRGGRGTIKINEIC